MSPEAIQLLLLAVVPVGALAGILWHRRQVKKCITNMEQHGSSSKSLDEYTKFRYQVPPSGSELLQEDFFHSLYKAPEVKE